MGVQILNKDVSILSSVLNKPKANIGNIFGIGGWAGGGGFQPGDFNFNNLSFPWFTVGTTNTVAFTKSGTLYISAPQSGDNNLNMLCYFSKNTPNTLGFYASTSEAITFIDNPYGSVSPLRQDPNFYAVCNVNIGDTMYFEFTSEFGGPDQGSTITFRVDSFTGTIIDTFSVAATN